MIKKSQIIEAIKENKIIAIVRGVEANTAINIAETLYSGGIKLIEVTFNTPGAAEMIAVIKKAMESKMYVGAGTVLDSETTKTAIDSGAEFILSPSLDKGMISTCNRYGKVAIPGIATPTEAVKAMQWGADLIKLFPAAALGHKYLKSIKGPLDYIEIVAVGGINLDNAKIFINAGSVGVGIGSSLVDKKLVTAADFKEIEKRAKQFVESLD